LCAETKPFCPDGKGAFFVASRSGNAAALAVTKLKSGGFRPDSPVFLTGNLCYTVRNSGFLSI
jgi:hypothetical protein